MSPNGFPKPPFAFDPTDRNLIGYLQGGRIGYLGDESRVLIARLSLDDDLSHQQAVLRELWPSVLTDALRHLKRHDVREWRDGIDFDSFFNRESLGMERLDGVLRAFRDFESLMYGARPERYRDHVVHTLRVWTIGDGLLRECLDGELYVPECDPASCLGLEISTEEWECIWAVAALCHDIGYPLTAVEHINERTRRALGPQGLRPLGDLRYSFSPQIRPLQETLLKLMSSKAVAAPSTSEPGKPQFLTHLQNKYYLKFVGSLDYLQHGVVSALVVGRSLVYFLESDFCHDEHNALSKDDARQFVIRREILRAMAAHTCPEIYHLRFDTLSFLLFVVDELQSWGRPTFEQLRPGPDRPEDDVVEINEFGQKRISIRVTTRRRWDALCQEDVKHQLSEIRKRLRLAVDAPKMKELALRYEVVTADAGEGLALELDGGKIAEHPIPKP